jgi:hypothetical protein
MNGYWFYNSSYAGGHWVNEESSDSGFWEYDTHDYTIGTWNNMDWSAWGTWYTDSEDTTIKHIEHDGEYDSSCTDTDNGVTDSDGDPCTEYTSNPSWCNTYDTETFISSEMCCACGGGTSYADDSDDDPDGIVYDEEYAFVASWYHNSTDTEDGYWVDEYDEVSGYWNYSDSSQSEGTWWHSNFTSQGTWYT